MHIEVVLRVEQQAGAEQWRMPELRGSRKNHPWGQKVQSEGQRRTVINKNKIIYQFSFTH